MTLHSSTRVPVDDGYAALVGKAVCVFAYYEWVIISIIELLCRGFVAEYSRNRAMTSGAVASRLRDVIHDPATSCASVPKEDLERLADQFSKLVDQRNALIHAHPCTDRDGSQILTYQARLQKPVHDKNWPVHEVLSIISVCDGAACDACGLHDRIRQEKEPTHSHEQKHS